MKDRASAVATVLFTDLVFTDLVGSTGLLARTGDEEAQRIFRATGHSSPRRRWRMAVRR
jgi:hypothetical protein